MPDTKYLVFTDLDATLLDHHTYSWLPAKPAIDALKEQECPLVLNSSKTLSEMVTIAEELGTSAPLVCENGALIAIPKETALVLANDPDEEKMGYLIYYLGPSRDKTLEILETLRSNPSFQFKGYNDWTVKDVAQHTGLPLENAEKSKERLGTEPIHWHGSEEAYVDFVDALRELGLTAVKGGRFIHISGAFTKASGVNWLLSVYQETYPNLDWTTVALGDSPNDTAMLSTADIAIAIPNKISLSPTAPRVIFAEDHGPTGWNTEILSLLTEL